MSLTYQRSRITGAGLVAAQYDLTLERQTIMDNILFIPGIANPVSEINQLLFGQGQQGTFIAPSLTASLISGSTFGTGVETLPDLSPRNNPFSQATPSSRGAWFREPKTGRRNLVTQTESIDNAVWTKDQLVTTGSPQWIFPGQGPNGQTAFKLILNNGVETAGVNSTGLRIIEAVTSGIYRVSFFAKAAEVSSLRIRENTLLGTFLVINLANGTITSGGGGTQFVDPLVTDEGSGWYRISFTTATMSNFNKYAYRQNANGDGTSGVLFTMPQYELRNATTPTAYQRVTTAFDVTEAGQRDCYGVRADGTDDFYTTASIDFTGTDKVTVFAALRKLSDAATGVFAELTNSIALNNGAFVVAAPALSGTDKYRFESKGTTPASANTTNVAFNAPITNVITGLGDIGAPLATLRVNGAVLSTITTTQGTGNYANDVLYLFRRGGTTLPFNGNLYALIVAGGSYPLSTIQRVERLLSRITPTVNL